MKTGMISGGDERAGHESHGGAVAGMGAGVIAGDNRPNTVELFRVPYPE